MLRSLFAASGKLDPNYQAIGIDLDEECLDYGANYWRA